MAKKKLNNEEKIIDLLEKNLIIQLCVSGATRDEIKKIIGIGTEKVNTVIKYIRIRGKKNNG
jgi:hypothetical protein